MRNGYFDQDGFLLFTADDTIKVTPPAGARVEVVPDAASDNDLFMLPTGQVVSKRTPVTPTLDMTEMALGETATIAGLPDPAFVMIDGVRQKVTGGRLRLKPDVARKLMIELAPPHVMDPLFVTVLAPTDLEAELLTEVDTQREQRQMAVMTTGGAKKYVYGRKADEAIRSRGIIAATLNALSLSDKQRHYPFALAEATLTGETLSVVLARFDVALGTSAAKVASIEAAAQKAKRAIRAATTAAAKRAAANVNWGS